MSKLSVPHQQYVFSKSSGTSVGELRFWLNWEESQPLLLGLCKGWVNGNEGEARELLSSAMLKAWEGAHKLQDEIGNYRAWLARIVRNHCIDVQRRKNRDPQIKTDPEQLGPMTEQIRHTHQISAENLYLKEESYARLLARMDGLPLRLREVMMLRAYQNMSYKEIGRHLHISTENARKRVQMARTLLKGNDWDSNDHESGRPEQIAAEAILSDVRLPTMAGSKFAAPVRLSWQGITLELPVLLDARPMRLAQKVETLRSYLDRHPSGWKKELELAKLLWTMGEATEALERIATVFGRQPHVPEIVLNYLRILQGLGANERIVEVAAAAAEGCGLPELSALYAGFEAQASGDFLCASTNWKRSVTIGGALQLAKMLLQDGQKAAAADLLRAHCLANPMDREGFLWMSLASGLTAEGLEATKLAHRRFPGDPYAIAGLLNWEMRQANSSVSPEMKTKVADATKQAPESYLMMALKAACFYREGDTLRALVVVKEFVQRDPNHFQALHFGLRLTTMAGIKAESKSFKRRIDHLGFKMDGRLLALDFGLSFLE